MDTLYCRACHQSVIASLRWQACEGGKFHLRASCPVCRGFIKFVPQTADNVAVAGPKPPPPPTTGDLFGSVQG